MFFKVFQSLISHLYSNVVLCLQEDFYLKCQLWLISIRYLVHSIYKDYIWDEKKNNSVAISSICNGLSSQNGSMHVHTRMCTCMQMLNSLFIFIYLYMIHIHNLLYIFAIPWYYSCPFCLQHNIIIWFNSFLKNYTLMDRGERV